MKNIILASTSTVYGSDYLDYLLDELSEFFKDVSEIVFIPYASASGLTYDDYTEKAASAFAKIDKKLKGIHTFDNPKDAIKNAEAIFVGGGNTFVLLDSLYKEDLIEPIKESVNNGTPYLGTSAGSNICGVTINNTNDMPIVYPPSFEALGLIPFNINPHYLDPNPESKHMGETRETRIKEFHCFNTLPVVGLREGSWLRILGDKITLQGTLKARVFEQLKTPYEVESGSDLSEL